ncbi:DUF4422 domain-containing protein [Phocaeicola faecalis]
MRKLAIYVCAHKQDSQTRTHKPYIPIQGGKSLNPTIDLGFITDNIGDNISDKNNQYSEWSVIYWIWKNSHDTQYVGLNHYRRYFNLNIDENNIETIIDKHDIIAVQKTNISKRSRIRDLSAVTNKEDAYLFIDAFLHIHPQSRSAIIEYLYNSKLSYPFSMFIMKRDLFKKFCEYVFPVLFELEKRISQKRSPKPDREIGYFGEFLLGLFILDKRLSVKAVDTDLNNIPSQDSFQNQIKKLIFSISDRLNRIPKDIVVPNSIRNKLLQDGIELTMI